MYLLLYLAVSCVLSNEHVLKIKINFNKLPSGAFYVHHLLKFVLRRALIPNSLLKANTLLWGVNNANAIYTWSNEISKFIEIKYVYTDAL